MLISELFGWASLHNVAVQAWLLGRKVFGFWAKKMQEPARLCFLVEGFLAIAGRRLPLPLLKGLGKASAFSETEFIANGFDV